MKKEQEESLNLEIIQACLKSENNRIRKGETNYGPKCVIYRENIKYVANSACLFRLVAKKSEGPGAGEGAGEAGQEGEGVTKKDGE